MKKRITAANALTASRLLLAAILVFLRTDGYAFGMVYLLCGFTDLLDGPVARKSGTVSEFGAKLDTVADAVFVCVCAVKILPKLHLNSFLWAWMALLAAEKILYFAWTYRYAGTLSSLHTTENRITGLLLFLFPIAMRFTGATAALLPAGISATIAAIREGHMVLHKK